ncbi:MAG TPA: hypothetical protein VF120_16445 [Ktedonobacterales bacterium]
MADPENDILQAVIAEVRQLREAVTQHQHATAQQQEIITAQQAEIAALRAAMSRLGSVDQRAPLLAAARKRSSRTSRRRLFQGAAAAAATVALVASEGQGAYATERIPASGIAWQTGVVNADIETFVEPQNGSFPDPALLAVRVGIAAPYLGLSTANTAAIAAYDTTTLGVATGVYATSSTGTAVHAESEGSFGLVAKSATGVGVHAETADTTNNSPALTVLNSGTGEGASIHGADDSNAVFAHSGGTSGVGVLGLSNGVSGVSGVGVFGISIAGYGLVGTSSTGVDVVVGDPFGEAQARLWHIPQSSAGAPSSGTYNKGEQLRDSNGELWLCVADGSPGTWVRAAHVPDGYSGGGIAYLANPIRLLDTRGSDPLALQNGGGAFASGSTHPLQIAGVTWQSVPVPATAVGAIGKVTAVSTPAGGGYIALVPHGAGFTGTANLPYGPSQTVATSFNVGLSGGYLDIIIGGNPTDVVIDLFGVVA